MIPIALEVAMLITVVVAIHGYLALEVWSLSRTARRDARASRGRVVDLRSVRSSPLEPLALPALPPVGSRPRLALTA